MHSQRQGDTETVKTVERLQQHIQIQTGALLQGVHIAAQWHDEKTTKHFALAVLDREQAGNNLRGETTRLDSDTEFLLMHLPNASVLQRITRLQQALDLRQRHDALQTSLKVIDLHGYGKPSRWHRADLQQCLQQALQQMRISLHITQDDIGDLHNMLTAALGEVGMQTVESAGDFVLTADLALQPAFESGGWQWLRGRLSIQLAGSDGTPLGGQSWPLKVSSLQRELLKPRLRHQLEEILKRELLTAILRFAPTKSVHQ